MCALWNGYKVEFYKFSSNSIEINHVYKKLQHAQFTNMMTGLNDVENDS